MTPVKAIVKQGRLIVDEPTDLPEGTELELLPVDDMDDDERGKLLAALDEADEDFAQGRHVDGFELIAALKARREAARR
jgi:hypothetical protein